MTMESELIMSPSTSSGMQNNCIFSLSRQYRYTLIHQWEEDAQRTLAVIGLNPSTADEQQLDPTLKKIRGFATRWGYGKFVMLNLFAYRATQPADMKKVVNPIGLENDQWIKYVIRSYNVDKVLLGWGTHGVHMGRDREVLKLTADQDTIALAVNANGTPKHPLYVPYDTEPFRVS